MSDPRIPRQLLGHGDDRGDRSAAVDPLGWCVIATTALLTWLIGPAVLAVLAVIGLGKYWRAWRSGRTDSSCILGDIRLVLVYLAVLGTVGIVATAISLQSRL